MDRSRPATGDEAALLSAIRASPEDDAPRLVYADWLDERGDTDRADFIRTQCRLAGLSPAEPEWCDLTEQERDLASRLSSRLGDLKPPEPRRFYFGLNYLSDHEPPFRRGLPYFIDCQVDGHEWTAEETTRVAAEFGRLAETTTVRGLHLYKVPQGNLAALLAAPGMAELSGLALQVHPRNGAWEEEVSSGLQLLVSSPAVRRVRHLGLYGAIPPGGVAALAGARSLGSVRRATLHDLTAGGDLRALAGAGWLQRLEHFHVALERSPAASVLLSALGELSNLHTLEVALWAPDGLPDLAAGRFPALGRLKYWGNLDQSSAMVLAGATFPRLAVFESSGNVWVKNEALGALMRADWFAGLRVLSVRNDAMGSRGIAALAVHPVARSLRVLRLRSNSFGKVGLASLARPGAFPALTTLDLGALEEGKATEPEMAAFLTAFSSPGLRHLDLSNRRLGDAGAAALARNPAFAGLTRLGLESCRIGEAGGKALFASPHLQRLVNLDLRYNKVGGAAGALLDPGVMPRLGECRLDGNDVPAATAAKLNACKDRFIIA